MKPTIDIVADMGEGFGNYRAADDASLLKLISSANIACGFHAGDPRTMAKTVELAIQNGVAIGAHPGFPDLVGFGRRAMDLSSWEITTDILYQIGALSAFAKAFGSRVRHVHPHGRLGNVCAVDRRVADAIAEAVARFDPSLMITCQPNSEMGNAAKQRGLRTKTTMYADRNYTDDGRLVSRKEPNALMHDPEAIKKRVVRMIVGKKVTTITGRDIPVSGDVLLLHGDNAESLAIAQGIRKALDEAGVEVKAFV